MKRKKQPKAYTPTIEETKAALEMVALLFSENMVITSREYPELELRGKIKNN